MTNQIQQRGRTSKLRSRTVAAALALTLAAVTVATTSAHAQTFTVLHNFTGTAGDGANPGATVTVDAAGNLYGDTLFGGTSGFGTVFEWVKTTSQLKVLHSFAGSPTDGRLPQSVLVRDSAGDLFGTTSLGGSVGDGTVFRMSRTGQERWVYSFVGAQNAATPNAGLVEDAAGNLYGTSYGGGVSSLGTVFRISKNGTGERVIHSFKGGARDGAKPNTALVRDAQGILYGTTSAGGDFDIGTLFVLSPKQGGGWRFKLLHVFGPPDTESGNPGSLILDSAGNLYGTALSGGQFKGDVFKIATATGRERILYGFTGTGGDGAGPLGNLVLDAAGRIYGTTLGGGSSGFGTVFRLTRTGRETVLHSFTGSDGRAPEGLAIDASGNLYGTTDVGGSSNLGTVFKLIP